MYLLENALVGNIPDELGKLKSLRIFDADFNRLSGLEYLIVGGNNFGGEVPRFDKLHNLFLLDMDNNQFGSDRPDHDSSLMSSLANATNLNRLYLQNNAFGGTFHEFFSKLSNNLAFVDLSNNRISGHIPVDIGKFVNLEELRLNGNHLT
ncbi:hypothetical protein HAX54_041075, partial [Datura stramonium]|nr:hypothetical protein [Datura stramonium]